MWFSAARPAAARLLLGTLAFLAACSSGSARGHEQVLAPTMTIERFLRAANQNDLDTMGSLFGTRDGPVAGRDSRQQVDDRMFLLASLLRHTDYTIGPEEIVPGRRDEAALYTVRMVIGNSTVAVPFTVVRSRKAPEWLIEQIGVDRITRNRGGDE